MEIKNPEGMSHLAIMLADALHETRQTYHALMMAGPHAVKLVSMAYEHAGDESPDQRAAVFRDHLSQMADRMRLMDTDLRNMLGEVRQATDVVELSEKKLDATHRRINI